MDGLDWLGSAAAAANSRVAVEERSSGHDGPRKKRRVDTRPAEALHATPARVRASPSGHYRQASDIVDSGLLSGPDTPSGHVSAPLRTIVASRSQNSRKQRAHAVLSADGVLLAAGLLGGQFPRALLRVRRIMLPMSGALASSDSMTALRLCMIFRAPLCQALTAAVASDGRGSRIAEMRRVAAARIRTMTRTLSLYPRFVLSNLHAAWMSGPYYML